MAPSNEPISSRKPDERRRFPYAWMQAQFAPRRVPPIDRSPVRSKDIAFMSTDTDEFSATSAAFIVGVTSHRNIPAGETEAIRRRVRALLSQLQREFPHSPLTVLSPLAEGGDQLVAEEGLDLGARLIAPLPFARERYAQDFVDPDARARFESLCARARIIELPLLPEHNPDDIAAHGPARDRHYARVGMFVARHCHLLLAIWDGKASDLTGGTAQTVAYYLTGRLPGDIERPRGRRLQMYVGGEERLLCHVVCSREQQDGAPASPLQPGQLIWRGPEEIPGADAPMPRGFHKVFEHADAFNVDMAAYAKTIAQDAAEGGNAVPDGDEAQPAPDSPAALFRAADWLAMHFQKRVLLAMRLIYLVAFVMAMALTVFSDVPNQDAMLYVFLALFAVGVAVSAIARRREWHRKYLDYRALAEGLRVQRYWRRAGISLTGDLEFAQGGPMQKQDIELGWVRNVMRSAGLADHAQPSPPDTAALHKVIAEWIGDEAQGELGYYKSRTVQRARTHRMTEMLGLICLAAGILISVALAVLVQRLSVDIRDGLIVIMAAFSIFAAVRESYSFRKADRELIRQYRFMERVFRGARAALDNTRDTDEQRDVLRALGEAALAEHVEWAVMHRQRPLEAGKM